MIEKSLAILFFPRKPKGYKTGELPIVMRITINNERKEIGTKHHCEPERWNSQAQRARGTIEKVKTLNAYLDSLELKVHEARLKLLESGKPVSVEAVVSVMTGHEEKPITLLDVFREHNKKMAALEHIEYAPGTVERYTTTLSHVQKFVEWKSGQSDIALKDLSFDFVSDMEFWLKSVRKCNHNSTIKYIANLRKIINICLKGGWLQRDPFYGFKMTKREVVREYLNEEELHAISIKQFGIERLGQVRDIFLFSCYTGLAFIDAFQLTPSNIAKGVDGNQWIFSARQKTDTPTRIPLLPQALSIVEKYKNHPKCLNCSKVLPVLSNQKMNSYLKEIADLCGITKTLTFHIARHTFATTVTLNNDVPIESVSKMLGHKSIKITQHYAKIMDKKVGSDMLLLQGRLSKNRGGVEHEV